MEKEKSTEPIFCPLEQLRYGIETIPRNYENWKESWKRSETLARETLGS